MTNFFCYEAGERIENISRQVLSGKHA